MKRFFLNVLIFLSIFFLPPWISLIFIISAIFVVDNLFESFLWAYIIDIIYGGGKIFGFQFHFFFTVITIIVFLLSLRLKTMLKFYSDKKQF